MVVTIIDKNDYFFLEYAPLIVDQIFRMSILTQFITLHASLKMFIFKYRKVISITFQQIQPAWQFGQMKGFELTDLFLEGSFCRTLILDKRPCWCKCISVPFPLYLFTFLAQIDYNSSHICTPFIFLLLCCFICFFIFQSRMDTFSQCLLGQYLVIDIGHWPLTIGHQVAVLVMLSHVSLFSSRWCICLAFSPLCYWTSTLGEWPCRWWSAMSLPLPPTGAGSAIIHLNRSMVNWSLVNGHERGWS